MACEQEVLDSLGEPAAEADLENGAEEVIAGEEGADVKGEALAEGGGASEEHFLDMGHEGKEFPFLFSREPGCGGRQRK
jgi:hypothetical protein